MISIIPPSQTAPAQNEAGNGPPLRLGGAGQSRVVAVAGQITALAKGGQVSTLKQVEGGPEQDGLCVLVTYLRGARTK